MAIVGGPIKIKNISNIRTLDIDNVVVASELFCYSLISSLISWLASGQKMKYLTILPIDILFFWFNKIYPITLCFDIDILTTWSY